MKIALITGDLSRKGAGVKEVVEGLSSALLDLGEEVEVFGLATDAWRAGDDGAWAGARAHGCRVVGSSTLGFAPKMLAELEQFDPDIVHLHGIWQFPTRVALSWTRKTGLPVVVNAHGMLHPAALAQSQFKKRVAGMLYVDKLLRAAMAFVGSAEEEVAHFKAYGLSQPLFHIPNGVDIRSPGFVIDKNGADRGRNMLFLSRFHYTKNVDALLDAWEKLYRSSALQDWTLDLVGWGSQTDELQIKQRVAGLHKIGAPVSLIGPLFGTKKSAAFRRADAFILPSLNETFPVAILEAWAACLPTLVSANCNMNAAIAENAAFEIGTTPDTLATDLRRFIALGRAEHQAMGQRAFELVRREFSWPVVAKQYLTVYEQAATQPQRLSSIDGMTEN